MSKQQANTTKAQLDHYQQQKKSEEAAMFFNGRIPASCEHRAMGYIMDAFVAWIQ